MFAIRLPGESDSHFANYVTWKENKEVKTMKSTNKVTKTANSLKGVTMNTKEAMKTKKEAVAMKTTTITINSTMTSEQAVKLARMTLKTLKEDTKKATLKTDLKKTAPKKVVKKTAPKAVKKNDRIMIRSTSTDCLVAYNLCMIRKGLKVYDIDAACKAAKAKGSKVSTLMFKKHNEQKLSFVDWAKRNAKLILRFSAEDILKACNGREDIAQSYIKAMA